jgi:hypothetical protein
MEFKMSARNNFFGYNGFVWWTGRIVNNADPLCVGRCQVRIFGWHSPNTELVPDADLPWAVPLLPLNNSSSFETPDVNEWVVGFFMDGESGQFPIMMGVLPKADTGENE